MGVLVVTGHDSSLFSTPHRSVRSGLGHDPRDPWCVAGPSEDPYFESDKKSMRVTLSAGEKNHIYVQSRFMRVS